MSKDTKEQRTERLSARITKRAASGLRKLTTKHESKSDHVNSAIDRYLIFRQESGR